MPTSARNGPWAEPLTDVFRPRSEEHPEDEIFPGLLLLKTEGVIHFANAQRIGELMSRLIEGNQSRRRWSLTVVRYLL